MGLASLGMVKLVKEIAQRAQMATITPALKAMEKGKQPQEASMAGLGFEITNVDSGEGYTGYDGQYTIPAGYGQPQWNQNYGGAVDYGGEDLWGDPYSQQQFVAPVTVKLPKQPRVLPAKQAKMVNSPAYRASVLRTGLNNGWIQVYQCKGNKLDSCTYKVAGATVGTAAVAMTPVAAAQYVMNKLSGGSTVPVYPTTNPYGYPIAYTGTAPMYQQPTYQQPTYQQPTYQQYPYGAYGQSQIPTVAPLSGLSGPRGPRGRGPRRGRGMRWGGSYWGPAFLEPERVVLIDDQSECPGCAVQQCVGAGGTWVEDADGGRCVPVAGE